MIIQYNDMTRFLFFHAFKDVDFIFRLSKFGIVSACIKLLVRDDAREGKSTLATSFAVLTKAVMDFRYKSAT